MQPAALSTSYSMKATVIRQAESQAVRRRGPHLCSSGQGGRTRITGLLERTQEWLQEKVEEEYKLWIRHAACVGQHCPAPRLNRILALAFPRLEFAT